jgi:hypothetical protein
MDRTVAQLEAEIASLQEQHKALVMFVLALMDNGIDRTAACVGGMPIQDLHVKVDPFGDSRVCLAFDRLREVSPIVHVWRAKHLLHINGPDDERRNYSLGVLPPKGRRL